MTPLHFVVGPAVAVCVVAVLLLVSRWLFGRPRRDADGVPDYGLLVAVSRVRPRSEAQALCDLLTRNGIRGTLASAGKGYDAGGRAWPPDAAYVLVFPDDAERARRVLATADR